MRSCAVTKGGSPPAITMKKHYNNRKRTTRTGIVILALCGALCGAGAAYGQGQGQGPGSSNPWGPNDGGGQGGPGGGGGNRRPPPLPPVIQALDTNHDGIIEPDEIANAAQSLKTLLKSGSDSLTIPDLLGPPRGRHPRGRGQNQGQGNGGGPAGPDMQLANPAVQSGTSGQDGPPPQDGQGGPGGNQDGPPGPPPGGPGRHHPPSPLMQALDTNHDGTLEADEIANASESLKKLDKNGDGKITPDELRPPPPPDGQAPPPPPEESGTNGQGGPPPPPPE